MTKYAITILCFAAFCAALPLLLLYVVVDEFRSPRDLEWVGD